jgi:hypothetical protein
MPTLKHTENFIIVSCILFRLIFFRIRSRTTWMIWEDDVAFALQSQFLPYQKFWSWGTKQDTRRCKMSWYTLLFASWNLLQQLLKCFSTARLLYRSCPGAVLRVAFNYWIFYSLYILSRDEALTLTLYNIYRRQISSFWGPFVESHNT